MRCMVKSVGGILNQVSPLKNRDTKGNHSLTTPDKPLIPPLDLFIKVVMFGHCHTETWQRRKTRTTDNMFTEVSLSHELT